MKWFDNTALTIVIIGDNQLGVLVGIFRFDLVASSLAISPGYPALSIQSLAYAVSI